MYIKVHKIQERVIVAVCDEELLGKKLEENNRVLEISKKFYHGEKKSEEEIVHLIKKAHIINLVGKRSVQLGIKSRIIDKNNVRTVGGIPHAQAITL